MQFVLALVLAFLPIGYSQESDEPDLGKKLQVLQTGNVDQQLEVLGSFHVKLLLDEVQESPRAISVIQPFLKSGNADIRAAAVIAFASVGGTRSRILQLCRDKEPAVRAAAVEAFLEAGGDPKEIQFLVSDPADVVRHSIAFRYLSEDIKGDLQAARSLLEDESETVRCWAGYWFIKRGYWAFAHPATIRIRELNATIDQTGSVSVHHPLILPQSG